MPYTRRTLVQRRHIKRHLRVVRERGIGKDLEELAEGCCCVAVPVLGARGEVLGAIGSPRPPTAGAREAAAHRAVLRDRRPRLERLGLPARAA